MRGQGKKPKYTASQEYLQRTYYDHDEGLLKDSIGSTKFYECPLGSYHNGVRCQRGSPPRSRSRSGSRGRKPRSTGKVAAWRNDPHSIIQMALSDIEGFNAVLADPDLLSSGRGKGDLKTLASAANIAQRMVSGLSAPTSRDKEWAQRVFQAINYKPRLTSNGRDFFNFYHDWIAVSGQLHQRQVDELVDLAVFYENVAASVAQR